MPSEFRITPKTLVLFFLILFGAWLVLEIRDILALIFIAFIFMSALRPAVDFQERLRIPRFLAIFVTYFFVFGTLFLFGQIVIPPLINETGPFLTNLPRYVSQVLPFINLDLNTVIKDVAPLGQNLVRVTLSVFSNIITVFTLVVFTFYFLLESNHLGSFLESFVGHHWGTKVVDIIRKVEVRLGAWIRGQLLLMFIIGVMSYFGLTMLGINYALPLALIAGILEVVPIIGPVISAVPAVLIALTVSPGLALAVAALYFIIQQLENNLVVPQVMRKAVGLPPLASLLALMIGSRLGGTLGTILSIPILLTLQTVLQEVIRPPRSLK